MIGYANALRVPFVYDDIPEIAENVALRDPWITLATGRGGPATRYVAYVSFAVNHALGGAEVIGYHAVNVAIHLATALLVYTMVQFAFRTPRLSSSRLREFSPGIAFCAAAIFVAHPLQTEAVTYIVQRITSLATLLYVATVTQYLGWRLSRDQRPQKSRVIGACRYALLIVTAAMAMKTKEIAITLPVTLVVAEISLFGPLDRRKIVSLAPIAITALLIPLSLIDVGAPGAEYAARVNAVTRAQSDVSRLDYLRTQIVVVARYLGLVFWPTGQSIDHDQELHRSFLDASVILSAAFLGILIVVAIVLHRRAGEQIAHRGIDPAARLVGFGVGWFFITLLVESSVIPIADVMVEHRVYLPSVGLFIAVATALALLVHLVSVRHAGAILAALAIAVASPLGCLTHQRNDVWSDEISLWSDAAAKAPGKARTFNNLGLALAARGDAEGAITAYRDAIRIDPKHEAAHNNLGIALYRSGRLDDAIQHFLIAIAIRPDFGSAHTNLGIAYGKKGWVEQAFREMQVGRKLGTRTALGAASSR